MADNVFPSDPDLLAVLASLRSFTTGTVLCDGVPEPARFVHDPRDGRIVLPLDPRLSSCEAIVVCLPDDSFETSMRVLLHTRRLPEHDLGEDVYLAYHGEAPSGVVLHGAIDSVKLDDSRVIEGELVMLANPLWSETPSLCKALNASRDRLRDAVNRRTSVEVDSPIAVGVDPFGVDVRARFGVVRVPFDAAVTGPDDARRAIEQMLETDA